MHKPPFMPTDREWEFLAGMDEFGWRRAPVLMALAARACARFGWVRVYPNPVTRARAYRITEAGRHVLTNGFAPCLINRSADASV